MSDDREQPNDEADHDRWQVSLATLLPLVLASLVVMAALPVIVIGYVSASGTAGRLLSQRAELILDQLESQIQAELDPVAAQLAYARQAVASGGIDPRDLDQLRSFTRGLLAATLQIFGVGLIGPDLSMCRWERSGFVYRASLERNGEHEGGGGVGGQILAAYTHGDHVERWSAARRPAPR